MALGYDGKLYILAFDHRGSFRRRCSASRAIPTPEETERITDAKHLIFEGLVKAARDRLGADRPGRRPRRRAVRRPTGAQEAKRRASSSRCRSRRAARTSSTSSTASDFGEHIEAFDPDFSKVLVRYNPEGDAEMNQRQAERLARLSDWLHEQRPQVPLRAAGARRADEQLARSTATPTATTPSCAPS